MIKEFYEGMKFKIDTEACIQDDHFADWFINKYIERGCPAYTLLSCDGHNIFVTCEVVGKNSISVIEDSFEIDDAYYFSEVEREKVSIKLGELIDV